MQTSAPLAGAQPARPIDIALLVSVFVIAACGLLYELAAGALASYLLGDSVLQFSTIIGSYLFAMGIGSWLSRYFEDHLPAHFLRIELMVALVGGDGMAVREVLKYPSVESVTLVELDPAMTDLFKDNAMLRRLNGEALSDARVHILNTDAFHWLQQGGDTFDVVIVDFPDPTNFAIGKLFTNSFYALLDKRLAASGYAVVQTTSPLIARKSYWTVVQTIESIGLQATPYHAHVPSFGEWGFVIASHRPWREPDALPAGLRFLSAQTMALMFDFPLDMARVPAEVNRLSNQVLVNTYEREWGRVER